MFLAWNSKESEQDPVITCLSARHGERHVASEWHASRRLLKFLVSRREDARCIALVLRNRQIYLAGKKGQLDLSSD